MKFTRFAFAVLASTFLWSGLAHADNDFIFRYKAELVGTDAGSNSGDPEEDIGDHDGVCEAGESGVQDCNGVCEVGEEGTPDCPVAEDPGDEEEDDGLIHTVDGNADYTNVNFVLDPNVPQRLSIVPTDYNRNVGADRIIYQCFKVSGGWHNYGYTMSDPSGDTSWVESFDIVMKSNLHSPNMPNAMLSNDTAAAPSVNPGAGTFGVTSESEACIRIKVAEGASVGGEVETWFYLDDYSNDMVLGGQVDEDDLWSDNNYLELPVIFRANCTENCRTEVPQLVVQATGGSADLTTLTEIPLSGYGYGPGPDYHPEPNLVHITGGVPPYNVQIDAESMGYVDSLPWGAGCEVSFNFAKVPVEFYPGPGTDHFGAAILVTDALGQSASLGITYFVTGTNENPYTHESSGFYQDTIDPAADCGYVPPPEPDPLEAHVDFSPLELIAGQDSTPFSVYGGTEPYHFEFVDLPPDTGLTISDQYGGYIQTTKVGDWTGENALKVKVTDEQGEYVIIDLELLVTPKPADIMAFGYNSTGAFGVSGSYTSSENRPYSFPWYGPEMDTVVAGNQFSCGLSGSDLLCWGKNDSGQTGAANNPTYGTSPTIVGGSGWTSVDAGYRTACGLENGTLMCWGNGANGILGNGSTSNTSVPLPVSLAGANWSAYSVGTNHACGISNGEMYCWGANDHKQLGLGSDTASKNVPTRVGTLTDWVSVSAGSLHTCGIRSTGEMSCWGDNSGGATGQAVTGYTSTAEPTPIAADTVPNSGWTSVQASSAFTCGLKGDVAYCWGLNNYGQLGHGDTANTNKPTVATGSGWGTLSAGDSHVCGLKGTDAYCWGYGYYGRLGQGSSSDLSVPTKVLPDSHGDEHVWHTISAGGDHTIGLVD